MYLTFKALHIIFMVTWMAGLFYLVRLFVYHREAQDKPSPEREILSQQFVIMEKRLLYGICWPSKILTLLFGFGIFHHFFPLTQNIWLIIKLIFVFFLIGQHHMCQRIFKDMSKNIFKWNSLGLRIFNEVTTFFLVGIVLLVVFKESLSALKLLSILTILSLILFWGIFKYRQQRLKI
jgi:putative membrane protein